MNKLFVPYEQSVELKELGFNEKCLCHYNLFKQLKGKIVHSTNGDYLEIDKYDNSLPAPLWQQTFDWFRTKHNLHYTISVSDMNGYFYSIRTLNFQNNKSHRVIYTSNDFAKYEEARLACLNKLIKIIKNQKK